MAWYNDRRWLSALGVTVWGSWLWLSPVSGESPAPDFDRTIAPLLASHCLDCHNGGNREGGLDLTNHEGMQAGGENGAVVEPGDPESSYLWQRVEGDEMPPKKRLADAEKALLKAWIAGGAKWGASPIDRFKFSTETHAGYDWWSLQPLYKIFSLSIILLDAPLWLEIHQKRACLA
ncbi:MAG: c-type cytochrome domain-containing protein, partial [Pirellulales bacterium]